MKKIAMLAAGLFQIFMLTKVPYREASESLLAGQLINQGYVPYRDFLLHIGPFPSYLFALLFSVSPLVWCSLVFIGFNFLSAFGLYKLCRNNFSKNQSLTAACMFLVLVPFFGGTEMYPEVIMTMFGIFGMLFAVRRLKILSLIMFLLCVLTKQTGTIYPVAYLLGKYK